MRVWWFCVCLLFAAPVWAAELRYLSGYEWTEGFADFGGYSGLWVAPGGGSFVAVSDRGTFVRGTLQREAGRIAGVTLDRTAWIHGPNSPTPKPYLRDAEGLAVDADGTVFVSFESYHRVYAFPKGLDQQPDRTHHWRHFLYLQQNSGMEALAIDKAGVVHAIPERSGQWTRPFPVFRLIDGAWDKSWSIPRSEKFLVAGADFGPDGKLYVLERLFEWYGGFNIRVRRFTAGADGFDAGETIFESGLGRFGNLEGISLWQNQAGETIVTMISDDNYNDFLTTRFEEFLLVE